MDASDDQINQTIYQIIILKNKYLANKQNLLNRFISFVTANRQGNFFPTKLQQNVLFILRVQEIS